MTSPGAMFARELIKVTAADILLLTLVTFFFVSGLAYKIKAAREVWKTRSSIRKLKSTVQECANLEQTLKAELKQLMDEQNANMFEVNRLRRKKADMAKLPGELENELEELASWCREKNIVVDFHRQMASRKLIRKQKPS